MDTLPTHVFSLTSRATRSANAATTSGIRRPSAFACVVAAWLLAPAPVPAATITIGDLANNIEVSWSGFDFFNVAGIPYNQAAGSVLVPDAIDLVTGAPRLVSFAGVWASSMPGFTYVHSVIHFQGAGGLSDVLQVDYGNYNTGSTAILSGVFSSAIDGVSVWSLAYLNSIGLAPMVGPIPEGQGIELVPTVLGSPAGLTSFVVNADIATQVPEPEPYAMLLAGVFLLGFATRRKQKEAAVA